MQTLEEVKTHLETAYQGATPGYPFGPGARVYKVAGKMFALVSENEDPLRVNLKTDPDDAPLQRAAFEAVIPGYHMNKKHWNTVILDGTIARAALLDMFDQSYELVFGGLKKADQNKVKVGTL